MLNKNSIKRILRLFKNVDIANISLIQSAYTENNLNLIKSIIKTKSSNKEYLKAIGRLSSQYIRLLNNSSNSETKILTDINSNFIQNKYHHNLGVFGNKQKRIIADNFRYLYNFKEERVSINSKEDFENLILNFNFYFSKYENLANMRVIAKYQKDNDFKYTSTKITLKKSEINNYLNNLSFSISKQEYAEYIDFELIEIIIRYYPPLRLPKL